MKVQSVGCMVVYRENCVGYVASLKLQTAGRMVLYRENYVGYGAS